MDRKNIIIIVLVVLLAAILAGGGVYLWQSSNDEGSEVSDSDESTETDAATADAVVDETQDETVDQTVPTISDEDAIRQAMADKHSKTFDETQITIDENDGDYADGMVSFSGEMGGGWFLAAKDSGGQWIIVADGNGTILCSDIAPYDFPVSMVPECYDEATSTLVTR